jgi:hypothetical protein
MSGSIFGRRIDLGEDALPIASPPGSIHFFCQGVCILLGELALSRCPLRLDEGDKAGLLRTRQSLLRKGDNDSTIGVQGLEGGNHAKRLNDDGFLASSERPRTRSRFCGGGIKPRRVPS